MPDPRISSQELPVPIFTWPPSQEQLMSTSIEGSVNGKCEARKRIFRSSTSKKALQNSVNAHLRWPRCVFSSIDQTLDLVEHRRVRLVAVAAEGAARHDDADRRLLRQHGADLHRARMGAQDHARAVGLLVEVERIMLLARRMFGGHVECGEIVEVVLDMRAFGDREAEIAPDLHDLLPDLAHRMDRALRLRRAPAR